STTATGSVTEDAAATALDRKSAVEGKGVDLIGVHTTSVTAAAGNPLGGTLTMATVSESPTTAAGTVGWTYSVADDATDYLAAGQSATESFTVTIDDGHGGTATQTVTVTVNGANEGPTIVAGSTTATGSVTEDAAATALSTSGTIAFADVDLTHVYSARVTAAAGNPLGGTLTMATVSESPTTAAGTVGWTYSVADDATDYLAAGQS